MRTTADVQTKFGPSYLKRLCRHFSHKVPTEFDDNHGRIEFPFGVCTIDATGESMILAVELPDSKEVDRAERVVGDHLVRMANKDEPVVEWVRD